MTSATEQRPALEQYGWAISAFASLAVLAALAFGVGVVVDVVQGLGWWSPGAAVQVDVPFGFSIAPPGGVHATSGAAVQAGTDLTATALTAAVVGLDPLTKVLLAAVPILQHLTGLVASSALAAAALALREPGTFGPRPARRVLTAAVAIALGGLGAQVVEDFAHLRLMQLDWQVPDSASASLIFDGFGITLEPLLWAAALTAVAVVLRRAARLQSDADGLV